MLDPLIVYEVEQLLARGLSQREIARRLPISRGTVQNIASGRRPNYAARKKQQEAEEACGPPRRCPGCGGMATTPCRLCRVRAYQARQAQRKEIEEDMRSLERATHDKRQRSSGRSNRY